MKDSIVTLLTSKRAIVAVVALTMNISVVLGLELDADKVATIVTAITTLAGILIGGISVSDHGKALGKPPGVDHKGRSAVPEDAPDPG